MLLTSTSKIKPFRYFEKFIPTRHGNPCPICGDTSGKCRTTDQDLLLCMVVADGDVPGFKFLGRTKDGLWGKFIPDHGRTWSQQEWDQYLREQKRIRQQRADEEARRWAASMPPEERDRYYRKLLEQLSLHPDDRADLHRRGVSNAQIEALGIRSAEAWQQLEQELPHTLPGVALDGRSLNISGPGYLCPIRDVAGPIVGFQVRLRDADDGGRYRWVTSKTQRRPNGPTPHLPNGELPLTVHRPEQLIARAIALVEGTGVKPSLAAQRLGLVTVGAAGGQFAASPQTLQATLEQLTAEIGTQTVLFYPDAGALLNPHVMRQYHRAFKLLQRWGYDLQVAWWGQVDKDQPDIDELDDLSRIQLISVEEFLRQAPPQNWIDRIEQLLKLKWRSPRQPLVRPSFRQQTVEAIVEYQAGERIQALQRAVQQGYRYILDRSTPGCGKSFDSGNVEPSTFAGIRQVIYASDQHRNPTVETLETLNGWLDLEARHPGLVREKTADGKSRLKRMEKGKGTPVVPSNCHRTQLIDELRKKHINGADTASLICGGCSLREACTHAEGPGYGFLKQRREALSSPKFRAHPDSLPAPIDYNYSDVALLWDEPGQNFTTTRKVTVRLHDLMQVALAIHSDPQLVTQLQPVIAVLSTWLNGSERVGRYGLNHNECIKLLPDLSGIDLEALEQVLQPDLKFLNTTEEYGVDLADLPAQLRKKFADRDWEAAQQAQQQVIKQWLPDFIRIATGQSRGYFHLTDRRLTMTLSDHRHRAIANAARVNIFLDATLSQQDLALKLGCDPQDILVVRQQQPDQGNLAIIQVTDLGRMGMTRGDDQQKRAAAIVAYYKGIDPAGTMTIDFKKYVADGSWWRDSRSVNNFEHCTRLIVIGTPCRNLSALQAEYAVLTGCTDPEDLGFKAFVDRTIQAEFHQAVGRLRAHRRPGENLEIIILSDFSLDFPTRQVKASDITLEAAGKWERFELAIQGAARQLQELGQKVTQKALAAIAGYSQQYISRQWPKLLQTLLEIPNSKSGKNPEPAPEQATLEQATATALNEVASQSAEITPDEIEQAFFEWVEPDSWPRVWEHLTATAQVKVLQALLPCLPGEQLQRLFALAGG